ncbi:hypothetical protein Ddye_004215 [Dipteronia dyeriana]|uniref:Uncharacterized protein n=1 Tax=Dipteronia dyeriana TaxID=168575 RepID=A0AAD9XTR4_9ROSI|nr:hypothetical protein Ddye_004215 [Dipteronia dyeriana]
MEFKVNSSGGIGSSSPKRSDYMLRSTRSRNQKTTMSNLMEAIAEMNNSRSSNGGGVVSESKEDHGVVRMKIKVRKEDLRQVLQVMKNVNNNNKTSCTNYNNTSYSSSSSMTLEQRLSILRRKHHLRGNNINAGGKSGGGSRRGHRSWSPVLQSIPEEL